MSEAEQLSRKKKVRAAHRASVTRMMTQAQELLSSGEESSAAKLRQKKQALRLKGELLRKLDDEIVAVIPEDELGEEIEQADIIQERIELVVIDLDGATDGVATTGGRESPPLEPDERERAREPPSHDRSEPAVSHDDFTSAEEALRPRSETPGGAPTAPRGSAPLADLADDSLLHARSTHVKLPKLSLKKFDGDLTKWTTFWDTFESAIHHNPALSSIDKFSYLISLLESAAAEAISGLTLTSANYEEAVVILKRRFGNKQMIVNRHMDLLLSLEAVTSQHNLKGLRKLIDVVAKSSGDPFKLIWGSYDICPGEQVAC